jgi:hypothetical protein
MVVTMERNPAQERRLGVRRKVVGRLGWLAPFTRSWRARRREKDLPAIALVEDLSMTGARLVVPRTEGLTVGAHAGVEADGHRGTVAVRWMQDHDDATRARVGVEFLALSAQLEERVKDLLGSDRREDVDWRWEIAR